MADIDPKAQALSAAMRQITELQQQMTDRILAMAVEIEKLTDGHFCSRTSRASFIPGTPTTWPSCCASSRKPGTRRKSTASTRRTTASHKTVSSGCARIRLAMSGCQGGSRARNERGRCPRRPDGREWLVGRGSLVAVHEGLRLPGRPHPGIPGTRAGRRGDSGRQSAASLRSSGEGGADRRGSVQGRIRCRPDEPHARPVAGFPDTWEFVGGLGPVADQIGNTVVPAVAQAMGRAILSALQGWEIDWEAMFPAACRRVSVQVPTMDGLAPARPFSNKSIG